MIDALDRAYRDFEQRVLVAHNHRDCPFGQHARTCYEEGFRAGWAALSADRDKYQALWHEQGLVSRRYREQAETLAADLERVKAGNLGRVLELEERIDTLASIVREYRQQHDYCNADPDDNLPHCPCDTCALALDALKSD